jgi:hypothetical protein
MSQAHLNRTPLWDRAGEVPTAFARENSKPTVASKVENFFYKRLQYRGSVDLSKRNEDQPQPKSMNYFAGEHEQDLARYLPPDSQAVEGAHPDETS